MRELLKDLKFLFKEIRWAWGDFLTLRLERRRKGLSRKLGPTTDKRINYGNRVLVAPVVAEWPTNIKDILNEDGTPKPPWKEM